ncbi:MAG: EAL domain-containing protein [Gallionella sp.]|nr:EAL domain-containing protein [Gallionella sp.]
MKNNLFELLTFNQSFTEDEQHLKFKVVFLNSVFLMAGVIAFAMGFYRWQLSPLMGAIEFTFSASSVVALIYLRHHKEKIEFISSLAIALCFLLFFAIFLLAPYNTMRLALFFLLSAGAFFLKGARIGFYWLLFILAAILAGYGLGDTTYSLIDIVTACIYLVALFVIFWNYQAISLSYQTREKELKLQALLDQRWRMALEGVGDAMWDWHIRTDDFHYSRGYAHELGYEESDLGYQASTIRQLIHPQDMSFARETMRAYLGGEMGSHYAAELRMRCKNGSYKWVLCRGNVIEHDAEGHPVRMIGTHVDINRAKQLEAELLVSQQKLRDDKMLLQAVLDHAPLGIWMTDPNSKVLFVNKTFCGATGIDEAQFLQAASYIELLPPNVALSCAQSDRECMQQDTPHVSSEWIPFVDEREHLLEIIKVRLTHPDGSVRGAIGIAADVTERKEHEQQLEHIAHYDALTGVPNRVLLADRLAQALARTKRDHGLMAVCYIDLDGFKPINDAHGHATGDKVLVEITRRIKEAIREDDTVARLGGDEFVVLLLGLQVPEECVGSLQRLLDSINRPIALSGAMVTLSASIGVSLYPEDNQDADTLLRHADQAMYVAKQSGKNRFHLFDAKSDLRARSHHELLQQIRTGLARGEFELYYQPKVEMHTRSLVGAEALIRWNHPQRGLLLPAEFLRAVENTELEIELGDWVVASALKQLRLWRGEGKQNFELSINVSAYHLQSASFVDKLKRQVTGCCAKPCSGCLQIEILETAALDDLNKVGDIIQECRAFGVGFALDDFGTGYSSLTYLSKLAVDTLKIDQSFVRDMLDDKGDRAIVQGIIALAKAFDMGVVAEGVENETHFQALLEMGCEVGQGYGIARPMSAAALSKWQ